MEGNPEKYEGVYLNRFLSSAYTPGSIFKLVTAAAALENIPDIENKHYLCEGRIAIGPDSITCLKAMAASHCRSAGRILQHLFAGTALELERKPCKNMRKLAGLTTAWKWTA